MTFVLRLECIGDDVYHASRNLGKMPAHAAREFRRRHRRAEYVPITPSVRDLSGRALPFQKDYVSARGRGARGVFKIYLLADGAYEVTETRTRSVSRRAYVIVEHGERRDVPREEAERWASSAI